MVSSFFRRHSEPKEVWRRLEVEPKKQDSMTWAGKHSLSGLGGAAQYEARVRTENAEGWNNLSLPFQFATFGAGTYLFLFYRVVQLNFTPEVQVLYMLLESFSSIFSMTYLKQHIKYFLFRRKIQLDLPVVFFYPLDVLHTEWSNRIETAKCNRLLNLRVKSCFTTLCNPHTCSSNQHSFVNEVDSTKYTITPTDNVPCIHDIMCSLLDTSEAAGGNEKKIFFEYFALCLVHAFMLKYLLRGCDSGDLRG